MTTNKRTINTKSTIKLVLGLSAIALSAAGGYYAYETFQKKAAEEHTKQIIEKLAAIKPNTFDAISIEKKYPPEKNENLDWQAISVKSAPLRKALAALQAKDDVSLESYQFLAPNLRFFYGDNTEPPIEESVPNDELLSLIPTHPGLALELGMTAERLASSRKGKGLTGWYSTPEDWYRFALLNGSNTALAKYESLLQSQKAYGELVDLFVGRLDPISDYIKAADYVGLAVGNGNASIFNDKFVIDRIVGSGPKVAAAAWKMFVHQEKPTGDIDGAAQACLATSTDEMSPSALPGSSSVGQNADAAIAKCELAVAAHPQDSQLWHSLGYALQSGNHWIKARVAYARAAELGNGMSIGRFWWLDYMDRPKIAVAMLDRETKSGNPWGDLFLGFIFGGSYPDVFNAAQAINYVANADKAGIPYAKVLLGELAQKKVKEAENRQTQQQPTYTTSPAAQPSSSSVEQEACERAKSGCYAKQGAMVQMCLNALRDVRGCD